LWLVGLLSASAGVTALAQEAGVPSQSSLTQEQIEAFLLNARVLSVRDAGNGVTGSRRATLTDGSLTHDAHVQTVDIQRNRFDVPGAQTELNFKDSYRYNIAGYRLARLLGLDHVPVSVERRIQGQTAAVTWWVDDVLFDEGGRQKLPDHEESGPNPQRTALQQQVMRMFDELIQNRDRNQGNILWTRDWKMWLIDHTRAFRLGDRLLKPELVQRCERSLCDKLRALTNESLTEAVGRSLTSLEIETVLKRRDAILKQIDARIGRRGESVVLFTLP
jgi:hypothetical protein